MSQSVTTETDAEACSSRLGCDAEIARKSWTCHMFRVSVGSSRIRRHVDTTSTVVETVRGTAGIYLKLLLDTSMTVPMYQYGWVGEDLPAQQ